MIKIYSTSSTEASFEPKMAEAASWWRGLHL